MEACARVSNGLANYREFTGNTQAQVDLIGHRMPVDDLHALALTVTQLRQDSTDLPP